MEWAVWTASSDSEDATTQEINEEEGAPFNRDQQESLNGARKHSSTRDAPGLVDLMSVKGAASTRNGLDSKGPVKADVGKKPSDNGGQDFIHFEKKQGIKLSAPDSMGSTLKVNMSEEARIPNCEPENITMQMSEEEDLGEWAEELECDSSTCRKEERKIHPGHRANTTGQDTKQKTEPQVTISIWKKTRRGRRIRRKTSSTNTVADLGQQHKRDDTRGAETEPETYTKSSSQRRRERAKRTKLYQMQHVTHKPHPPGP